MLLRVVGYALRIAGTLGSRFASAIGGISLAGIARPKK
jgi:hypothetical protein